MGGLLCCFRTKPRLTIKCFMAGLESSGKTTILYKCKLTPKQNINATIGVDFIEIFHKGVMIEICDAGGNEHIRPLWRHYYSKDIQFVIFVIDSADNIDRLNIAKQELHTMCKNEILQNAMFIILANKQD